MGIITVFLTTRCNLDCAHCFWDKEQPRDFPKPLLIKLIKQAHSNFYHVFTFTGGEPILYPNLAEMIELIDSLAGTKYSFVSNGLLFDSYISLITKFRRNFTAMAISMDDLPDTRNSIRGPEIKDKYPLIFEKLVKNGIPFDIKTCLGPETADKTDDFIKLARHYGARTIEFSIAAPTKNAKTNKLVISPAARIKLIKHLHQIKKSAGIPVEMSQELLLPTPFGCHRFSLTELVFDIDGNLTFCPCTESEPGKNKELISGNLADLDFKELILRHQEKLNHFIKAKINDIDKYSTGTDRLDYTSCFYCFNKFKKT